jgi:hypothetical protein
MSNNPLQYSDQLASLDARTQSLVLNARNMTPKQFAQARFQENARRLDSVSPGNGLLLARDVEYAYQEVLRTKYSPLSALTLFPTDSRVPPGALTYKIKRVSHQGEARYHRGNNSDIPRSGASAEEQIRPVRHIVTSIALDMFEQQSASFAGVNLRGELQQGAVRSIQEFLNTKTWHGDNDLDVYGVLNYPYVPKVSSTISVSSATADPMDILEELHRLASLASEISDNTFMPNTLVMPVRQANYIAQTKLSSSDLSETIRSSFLKENQFITSIQVAPELAGAGPNGEDVMFLFRSNDQNSVANVVPQGFTMLPVQQQNFNMTIPCYMSHGGVRMVDPLNNAVVYTPAVS